MKLSICTLGVCLPAFISAQTSTTQTSAAQNITSTTQCRTVTAGKPKATCPTFSGSLSANSTIKLTVTLHPTKTVNKTITDTITTTSVFTRTTVLSQDTDTITETTLTTTNSTATAPTSTETILVTQNTTTTTTLGKFVPVQSTLPKASQGGVSREVIEGRDARDGIPARFRQYNADTVRNIFARQQTQDIAKAGATAAPNCKAVYCTALTTLYVSTTFTKTGATVTSKFLTDTTTTKTRNFTVIETSAPVDASTTITQTSTITNELTTTPISKTTSTVTQVFIATETARSTCEKANFANAVDGEGLKAITAGQNNPTNNELSYVEAANATSCCEACTTNPACSVWFFGDDAKGCGFLQSTSETCSLGGNKFKVRPDGQPGSGFTLGNGNCGVFDGTY